MYRTHCELLLAVLFNFQSTVGSGRGPSLCGCTWFETPTPRQRAAGPWRQQHFCCHQCKTPFSVCGAGGRHSMSARHVLVGKARFAENSSLFSLCKCMYCRVILYSTCHTCHMNQLTAFISRTCCSSAQVPTLGLVFPGRPPHVRLVTRTAVAPGATHQGKSKQPSAHGALLSTCVPNYVLCCW